MFDLRTLWFKVALMLALAGVASCTGGDLDRDTALTLIRESADGQYLVRNVALLYLPGDGTVHQEELIKVMSGYEFRKGDLLRIDGKPTLTAFTNKESNDTKINIDILFVTLSEETTVDIEVTGITKENENSTSRAVTFRWAQPNIPAVMKAIAFNGGAGTATIQLYDDGWRVEGIELDVFNMPFELSGSERGAIDRLGEAEKARR
jgi:hypothetical protein